MLIFTLELAGTTADGILVKVPVTDCRAVCKMAPWAAPVRQDTSHLTP